MSDTKPFLVGGVGEINFGKQYRQGNRIYDSNAIAMCLHAQPVGNAGGNSYLYLVEENIEKESDIMTRSKRYYDADEQAVITQTEAEERATEIALRIKEGNLDPIPSKENKHFEQNDFTYVSLFSGIGGFEQALNKLGGTCVFASEFDKFAQQSYTALYGDDHLHGDITKIEAKDIPDHGLLVGGFPCQAFSVAGKRKGLEDARGTLFFDIARIAAEKKPKALLLENVKGLVNHDKGRTLDTMIETLNSIGYTVDFDVPQNRERIFIVAVRSDLIEDEPFSEESTTGQTIVPRGKRRIGEWAKTFNFDFPEQTEVTTRLRDILEPEVDEKYYLSDDKTATLVAQLGAKNPDERMSRQAVETYNKSELPKEHGDIIHAFRREHLKDGICPTISTRPEGFKTAPLPVVEEVRPVLTPDRAEKRQNGRRFKEDGEESFTLTSQDKHGVALGSPPKYRIRKLTPLECFRLQGFPDEAHHTLVDAGISDSQRYKQAGNAVTVNVIEAIGKRLIPMIAGI